MDWNPKQDSRPATQDLRLYRRGVWMVEELLVRDDQGAVIGKLVAKREMSSSDTLLNPKMCVDFFGAQSPVSDPYPGEGL